MRTIFASLYRSEMGNDSNRETVDSVGEKANLNAKRGNGSHK